jgi:hypothetical protein
MRGENHGVAGSLGFETGSSLSADVFVGFPRRDDAEIAPSDVVSSSSAANRSVSFRHFDSQAG